MSDNNTFVIKDATGNETRFSREDIQRMTKKYSKLWNMRSNLLHGHHSLVNETTFEYLMSQIIKIEENKT